MSLEIKMLLLCYCVSAIPVDLREPIKRPEILRIDNAKVKNDQDFPPLPQPEKPILERQSSVKDLVNFWEQRGNDDSRPSSPVSPQGQGVNNRPVISKGPTDLKNGQSSIFKDTTIDLGKKGSSQPVISKAELPKEPTFGQEISKLTVTLKPASRSTASIALNSPKPLSSSSNAGSSFSNNFEDSILTNSKLDSNSPKATESVKPQFDLQSQKLPFNSNSGGSAFGSLSQRPFADKPVPESSNKGADRVITSPGLNKPTGNEQKTGEDPFLSIQRRPSLPKEVQDELIATVARKEAEKKEKGDNSRLPFAAQGDSGFSTSTSGQRRPSLPKEIQDELIATVAKKEAEKKEKAGDSRSPVNFQGNVNSPVPGKDFDNNKKVIHSGITQKDVSHSLPVNTMQGGKLENDKNVSSVRTNNTTTVRTDIKVATTQKNGTDETKISKDKKDDTKSSGGFLSKIFG
ncbi:uncharacterized protein LOC136025889 [Artemia franciscana]|uniref:Uncharacterized protein n=1 Tax=Artemia franciscana TaxID=6661 RepID=A0AA88HTT7_ARTSF|nr:hypothetical protein QYM36_012024 [Artemia franciscana]